VSFRPVNAKGRNKHSRHIRLDHSMLGCPAFVGLTGNAVKVLLHIASLDNGSNNGAIVLSVRQAGEATGLAKSPAARAIAELTDAGFIVPTSIGAFSVKAGPAASTWRLTWVPAPADRGRPTTFYPEIGSPSLVTVMWTAGGTVHNRPSLRDRSPVRDRSAQHNCQLSPERDRTVPHAAPSKMLTRHPDARHGGTPRHGASHERDSTFQL
jgi:hypothetical protein